MSPRHGTHGRRRWTTGALAGVLLSACLALLAALSPIAPGQPLHAAGASVHYKAGWNLVAAPTGTEFKQATGQFYAYSPASDSYVLLGQNDIVAGRAVWAFFPQDVDQLLGATAAKSSRILLTAEHFALIGNPSATETLAINNADMALVYDTVSAGYQPVGELKPGQGAWVLAHSDRDVTLGKAPTGELADAVRKLQVGLTQDAADLSNFGKIPAIAEKLLAGRQYDVVQAAMDDLRASFFDGLLREKAAQVPHLTRVQRDAAVAVREALADASSSTLSGGLVDADSAVDRARRQAQISEDDAAAVARAEASGRSLLPLYAADPTYTPASLAAYGRLCTATVLALALNLGPTPAFVGLVLATLNNTPLPPVATPVPAMPAPANAAPAPARPPAACSAATLTVSPNAAGFGSQRMLTFSSTGLDPSAPYNLFFAGVKIGSGTTDAGGNVTTTLPVAIAAGLGATPVVIATATRCGQASFTITIILM